LYSCPDDTYATYADQARTTYWQCYKLKTYNSHKIENRLYVCLEKSICNAFTRE
jgi:hypothetical protein